MRRQYSAYKSLTACLEACKRQKNGNRDHCTISITITFPVCLMGIVYDMVCSQFCSNMHCLLTKVIKSMIVLQTGMYNYHTKKTRLDNIVPMTCNALKGNNDLCSHTVHSAIDKIAMTISTFAKYHRLLQRMHSVNKQKSPNYKIRHKMGNSK